jgi:hypothetical protein
VVVTRQPFQGLHRRRFVVTVNQRMQYEPASLDEVLPHVEWAINWEVPLLHPEYLHLHASSLARGGVGVMLPADSGSGKSTLAAALVTRGWEYLCDEFALIDAETLALHPFPRAVCIKEGSWEVMERLGVSMAGRRHYVKGVKGFVKFVPVRELCADTPVPQPRPIRFVVFRSTSRGRSRRSCP